MNLRLDDDRSDRLREEAEAENRSMQQVVVTAIDDYLERKQTERVRALGAAFAARHATLLERLADS